MSTVENFIISYSGGKDAAFACYLAMKNGMKPDTAITTFDRENACSWFHKLPESLLKQVETAIGFEIRFVDATANNYEQEFESALESVGVKTAVFGSIDVQEHYDWCDERCRNAGLRSMFPLWQMDRRKIVAGIIDAGFLPIITTIDTTRVSEEFLGKTLTHEIVAKMIDAGIDPCGENGEFHTFVYDGPIFRKKIEIKIDKTVRIGDRLYLMLH